MPVNIDRLDHQLEGLTILYDTRGQAGKGRILRDTRCQQVMEAHWTGLDT